MTDKLVFYYAESLDLFLVKVRTIVGCLLACLKEFIFI